MESIIVTPRSKKSIPFLKRLLESLDQVKHVHVVSLDESDDVEDKELLDEMIKARAEGNLDSAEKAAFLAFLKNTAGV